MKTLNYIVLVLSIIFVLLFTSIEIVSVLKPLYEGQYKSNKVYDVAYVKDYPVAQVTDDIILYLAENKLPRCKKGLLFLYNVPIKYTH